MISDSKKIQNQSGNVVAVPPDVHGGHGGEGGHHHVHLVQVRHIKYKSRIKSWFENNSKSVWKCSCCTSRCTWRTWWWGWTSCWGQKWIDKYYCYCDITWLQCKVTVTVTVSLCFSFSKLYFSNLRRLRSVCLRFSFSASFHLEKR